MNPRFRLVDLVRRLLFLFFTRRRHRAGLMVIIPAPPFAPEGLVASAPRLRFPRQMTGAIAVVKAGAGGGL
jgi:hypothetical protein